MAESTVVTVSGKSIRTHELTVAEVREWIKNAAREAGVDLVDNLLFDDFALSDFKVFTNLTEEEVDALTPSELRKVIDAVKEANPHFFELRMTLVTMGQRVQAQIQNLPVNPSNETLHP